MRRILSRGIVAVTIIAVASLVPQSISCRSVYVQPPSGIQLEIFLQKEIQFNPLILGSNVNWVNGCDGLLAPRFKGREQVSEKLVHDLGTTMLRFPGGSLSETYQWQKGIGPISERGDGPDYGDRLQKMICGTDEFLRFCQELNIVPLITVPSYRFSVKDVCDWVQYCNGDTSTEFGRMRAQNGHPSPYDVKYWEIGNEYYIRGINYETASQYAANVFQLATAMKKTDPKIQIGAIGLGVSSIWDNTVLAKCSRVIDFLVYHRYLPNAYSKDKHVLNAVVIASTRKMILEIKHLQDEAKVYNKHIKVAVTEYNEDYRDKDGKYIDIKDDVERPLFIAECLRNFFLNDVFFATKWTLSSHNEHFFADINFHNGGELTLSPSYYVQQMFAHLNVEYFLKTSCNSPTINSTRLGEVQAFNNLPLVTVIAGIDKDSTSVTAVVINRSLDRSFDLNAAPVGMRFANVLSAETYEAVGGTYRFAKVSAQSEGENFAFVVPGMSVTRITFSMAR